MVATDAELMTWVEEQLQNKPEVTVDELFEGAKALNPDVAELNKRQFHARYPLQVKRRAMRAAAAESGAAQAKAPAKTGTLTDGDVMNWVAAQLKNNPEVSVDELLAGAVKLNPEIAQLSRRQFHARYPLQVKRAARRAADAAAGIKPRRRRAAPPPEAAPAPEAEAGVVPEAAQDTAPSPPAETGPEPAAEAAPEAAPAAEAAPEAAPAAEAAPEAAPAAAEAAPAGPDRDAIRKVLFTFAADVTAAEGKKGVVKVLAAIDDYIDQIV